MLSFQIVHNMPVLTSKILAEHCECKQNTCSPGPAQSNVQAEWMVQAIRNLLEKTKQQKKVNGETVTSPTEGNFTPHFFIPEIAHQVRSQRSKRNQKLCFDRQMKTVWPKCQGKMSGCQKDGPGRHQPYYNAVDLVWWDSGSWATDRFLVCIALNDVFLMSFPLPPFLLLNLPAGHQQEGPHMWDSSCSRLVFLTGRASLGFFRESSDCLDWNRCYIMQFKSNWIMERLAISIWKFKSVCPF